MSKTIAENRKARFDYEILETYEAGIALTGAEIKAIRGGKANLAGSYGRILWRKGKPEAWLVGTSISVPEGDSTRSRKLLLHKEEINRLLGKMQEKGLTLIPLGMHFKRGYAKVQLGLGRGRKKHDKRERIKERESRRELRQLKAK